MIDKKLLALLGANKKYIYYTVALMILGLFANLSITAAICRTIELAVNFQQYETARVFLLPAAIAAAGAAVRYAASRGAGELRDTLGRRAKKELRERVYGKIVRLGVRSADGMSMAGLTQVAMEGVEQLDLYYFQPPAAVLLRHACTAFVVCHYRRHFVARGFGAFVLCAVDPAIH